MYLIKNISKQPLSSILLTIDDQGKFDYLDLNPGQSKEISDEAAKGKSIKKLVSSKHVKLEKIKVQQKTKSSKLDLRESKADSPKIDSDNKFSKVKE